jgi:hypothetical protein
MSTAGSKYGHIPPGVMQQPYSAEDERHRMWRVAGTTEPQRAMRGVDIVRFCVPLLLDDVSGDRMFRKASLALYRVPEHDDGDDVYIAADENLPLDRRPAVTPERLDAMEYLGRVALTPGGCRMSYMESGCHHLDLF